MKLRNSLKIFLALFCLYHQIAIADTCPIAEGLNPSHPPAGWKLLLPPVLEDQHYFFGAAIHSINGAYYYEHVICKYEACPSTFCPAYALISDKAYQYPNSNASPWNKRSVLAFTFTCVPDDHDPSHCVFK